MISDNKPSKPEREYQHLIGKRSYVWLNGYKTPITGTFVQEDRFIAQDGPNKGILVPLNIDEFQGGYIFKAEIGDNKTGTFYFTESQIKHAELVEPNIQKDRIPQESIAELVA